MFKSFGFRPGHQGEQRSHEDILEQPIPHGPSRLAAYLRSFRPTLPTRRARRQVIGLPKQLVSADIGPTVARGRPAHRRRAAVKPRSRRASRARPSAARRCARRSRRASGVAHLAPARPAHTPGTTLAGTFPASRLGPLQPPPRNAPRDRGDLGSPEPTAAAPEGFRRERLSRRPHPRVGLNTTVSSLARLCASMTMHRLSTDASRTRRLIPEEPMISSSSTRPSVSEPGPTCGNYSRLRYTASRPDPDSRSTTG